MMETAQAGQWYSASFDITGQEGRQVAVLGGCIYLRVSSIAANSAPAGDGMSYLDALSFSNTKAAYMYASGTSMATPMVTGVAAVAAKAQGMPGGITQNTLTQAELAQKARERVQWLKAHVTQQENMLEQCTTGGMIDLSTTKTLPVVDAATSSAGTVTITGAYFGAQTAQSYLTRFLLWTCKPAV